jgi:hypothetical protein
VPRARRRAARTPPRVGRDGDGVGFAPAVHIARCNDGRPADHRYARVRERDGRRFWLTSLDRVYLVQAVPMWTVALPLPAGSADGGRRPRPARRDRRRRLGGRPGLRGDRRPRAHPLQGRAGSGGQVMDRGLWRYTRHPNYVGDVVAWWGIGIVALGGGEAWWALIGPAVNTLILAADRQAAARGDDRRTPAGSRRLRRADGRLRSPAAPATTRGSAGRAGGRGRITFAGAPS